MAIFKPSHMSPNFNEVNPNLENYTFEFQVNTNGSKVRSWKLEILNDRNDEEEKEANILATFYGIFEEPLYNKDMATITIASDTLSVESGTLLDILKNESNYRWRVRVYEDEIDLETAASSPIDIEHIEGTTYVGEGNTVGTTKSVIWTSAPHHTAIVDTYIEMLNSSTMNIDLTPSSFTVGGLRNRTDFCPFNDIVSNDDGKREVIGILTTDPDTGEEVYGIGIDYTKIKTTYKDKIADGNMYICIEYYNGNNTAAYTGDPTDYYPKRITGTYTDLSDLEAGGNPDRKYLQIPSREWFSSTALSYFENNSITIKYYLMYIQRQLIYDINKSIGNLALAKITLDEPMEYNLTHSSYAFSGLASGENDYSKVYIRPTEDFDSTQAGISYIVIAYREEDLLATHCWRPTSVDTSGPTKGWPTSGTTPDAIAKINYSQLLIESKYGCYKIINYVGETGECTLNAKLDFVPDETFMYQIFTRNADMGTPNEFYYQFANYGDSACYYDFVDKYDVDTRAPKPTMLYNDFYYNGERAGAMWNYMYTYYLGGMRLRHLRDRVATWDSSNVGTYKTYMGDPWYSTGLTGIQGASTAYKTLDKTHYFTHRMYGTSAQSGVTSNFNGQPHKNKIFLNSYVDNSSPYRCRLFVQPNLALKEDFYKPVMLDLYRNNVYSSEVNHYGKERGYATNSATYQTYDKDISIDELDGTQYLITYTPIPTNRVNYKLLMPQTQYEINTNYIDSIPEAYFYVRQDKEIKIYIDNYYMYGGVQQPSYEVPNTIELSNEGGESAAMKYRDGTIRIECYDANSTEENQKNVVTIKNYRIILRDKKLNTIMDTGELYDGKLSYDFFGFKDGEMYSIIVYIEDNLGKVYSQFGYFLCSYENTIMYLYAVKDCEEQAIKLCLNSATLSIIPQGAHSVDDGIEIEDQGLSYGKDYLIILPDDFDFTFVIGLDSKILDIDDEGEYENNQKLISEWKTDSGEIYDIYLDTSFMYWDQVLGDLSYTRIPVGIDPVSGYRLPSANYNGSILLISFPLSVREDYDKVKTICHFRNSNDKTITLDVNSLQKSGNVLYANISFTPPLSEFPRSYEYYGGKYIDRDVLTVNPNYLSFTLVSSNENLIPDPQTIRLVDIYENTGIIMPNGFKYYVTQNKLEDTLTGDGGTTYTLNIGDPENPVDETCYVNNTETTEYTRTGNTVVFDNAVANDATIKFEFYYPYNHTSFSLEFIPTTGVVDYNVTIYTPEHPNKIRFYGGTDSGGQTTYEEITEGVQYNATTKVAIFPSSAVDSYDKLKIEFFDDITGAIYLETISPNEIHPDYRLGFIDSCPPETLVDNDTVTKMIVDDYSPIEHDPRWYYIKERNFNIMNINALDNLSKLVFHIRKLTGDDTVEFTFDIHEYVDTVITGDTNVGISAGSGQALAFGSGNNVVPILPMTTEPIIIEANEEEQEG